MGLEDKIEGDLRNLNVRGVVYTAIIMALAFVVGLFWRDAITATIEQIIPQGEGLYYKYLAAVIVTIVVVIIVYVFVHGQRVAEKRLAELHEELKNKNRKRKGLLRIC